MEWKHSLCSWIWRFNTVQMTILDKVIYSFDTIFIKIPMSLFEAIGKPILKYIWNLKWSEYSKQSWKKQNNIEKLTLFYFKTYYKATAIKTAWYWQKVRHTDQWGRLESPQIKLYIHGQLIFFRVIEEYVIDMANWFANKGAKTIQQGKDCLFNMWCWEYWISTCKRNKSGEFHSGPVVRTQHIHCHGPDSIPSQGRSLKPHSEEKKMALT